MDRYLKNIIISDALDSRKMAFISGPRQVGKTTLGESIVLNPHCRFNWDEEKFKLAWAKSPTKSIESRNGEILLFDEIHKDRLWKSKLKGLYDTQKNHLKFVVTGSARLDFYRKGGDSLLGRYFPYRLHPFTINETGEPKNPKVFFRELAEKNFLSSSNCSRFQIDDLLNLTGFPEPLLGGSESRARRWSKLRLERLIKEDVRDLRNVSDLQALGTLVQLLPSKVGSPFSVNSLRESLSVAYATVRDWVGILESLYVHFSIYPHSKKLSRMLVHEPKIYLFDGTRIVDRGLQLENLAALHLQKLCQYWTDTAQGEFTLRYLRNKEKQEVDFCVVEDDTVRMLIECKSSDTTVSPALIKFSEQLQCKNCFQLVDKPGYLRYYPAFNTHVIGYDVFLQMLI